MALPRPEPGLVLSYNYLWREDALEGRDDSGKDRPSVIVLVAERAGDATETVTVLPITHSAPRRPGDAVEIPIRVGRHLGLDDAPSWIVVTEGNTFAWPGYDLRRTGATGRFERGFLPPRFFRQVLEQFEAFHRGAAARMTSRD